MELSRLLELYKAGKFDSVRDELSKMDSVQLMELMFDMSGDGRKHGLYALIAETSEAAMKARKASDGDSLQQST